MPDKEEESYLRYYLLPTWRPRHNKRNKLECNYNTDIRNFVLFRSQVITNEKANDEARDCQVNNGSK